MPKVDAVVLVKWAQDTEGRNIPNALSDVFAWAIANGENLPGEPTCFGRRADLTHQASGLAMVQRILDNLAVFCARLEVTVVTAQQFAADPRIWTLGYRQLNDDGEVTFSNWNGPLSSEERQQAITYVTANSAITAQQLAAVFDVDDTRLEIAEKLKAFFRE